LSFKGCPFKYEINEARTFLCGLYNFFVQEIEVETLCCAIKNIDIDGEQLALQMNFQNLITPFHYW
jgi:hypothetical protein